MDDIPRSGDDGQSSSSDSNTAWARVEEFEVEIDDNWLRNLTGENAPLLLLWAVRSVNRPTNFIGDDVSVENDECLSMGS